MAGFRESPGIVMPLFGAAAGAVYGSSKEGKKSPLLFALVGASAGVFLGVFMGSMRSEDHRVGLGGRGGRGRGSHRYRPWQEQQPFGNETE
jgi:hypothetical protein